MNLAAAGLSKKYRRWGLILAAVIGGWMTLLLAATAGTWLFRAVATGMYVLAETEWPTFEASTVAGLVHGLSVLGWTTTKNVRLFVIMELVALAIMFAGFVG
ncbi:MAG: hypothetical protein ABIJ46_04020 [bacterium]